MSRRFEARIDALPPAQMRLWPQLRNTGALGFTLYGGTAVALRLGHRDSADFDFFSEKPLDRTAVIAALPFVERSTTLQEHGDSWVLQVPDDRSPLEHVKVSFFGAIAFGRVGEPEYTDDGVALVASMDDLMATKAKVVLQRAEAKDYRDVAAMIRAGASLPRALASARLLFGPNFQPSEALKALVYFDDGDLGTLDDADRTTLIEAVKKVRDLPAVTLLSKSLGAAI